jgi:hypothetical protein
MSGECQTGNRKDYDDVSTIAVSHMHQHRSQRGIHTIVSIYIILCPWNRLYLRPRLRSPSLPVCIP